MDEEDEIKSERSGSRPPSPSPPAADNGHASVTVASVHPPAEGSLTLALPIQQPRTAAGREDCWSEGATGVLIGAWGERYIELSRGNLKQKHWKEVAEIVSARENYSKPPKTDIQCKNRIDTVKKKYKLEKTKVAAGGRPSKWAFFETMDRLIGPVQAQKSIPSRPGSGPETKGNPNPRREKPPHPIRRSPSLESDSNGESSDESLSLPAAPQKKARTQAAEPMRGKSNGWAELSRAILRFGETYEKAEMVKMREAIEMEKRWMKFGKEMEVQRMELMMKTQVEISKMKNGRSQSQRRKGGGGSSKPQ